MKQMILFPFTLIDKCPTTGQDSNRNRLIDLFLLLRDINALVLKSYIQKLAIHQRNNSNLNIELDDQYS